jgi:hypothetical protein
MREVSASVIISAILPVLFPSAFLPRLFVVFPFVFSLQRDKSRPKISKVFSWK